MMFALQLGLGAFLAPQDSGTIEIDVSGEAVVDVPSGQIVISLDE